MGKGGIRAAARPEGTLGKEGQESPSPPSPKAVAAGLGRPCQDTQHAGPGPERMEAKFMWGLSWTQR